VPEDPEPTGDERELFLRWLAYLRESLLTRLDDIDEAQARWTPDGKLIQLLGIVNHLAHVERRWTDGVYLGGAFSRSEEEFRVPVGRTIAEVVVDYRAAAANTEAVVRAAPSTNDPCRSDRYPGIDLRWVLIHLVEETARHAGHADATRELLDGKTGD
jgi:hypothetical protein